MQCSNQFEIVYGCFDPATAHVCPYVGFSRLTIRDVFLALISPNPTQTKLCVPNVCITYVMNTVNVCAVGIDIGHVFHHLQLQYANVEVVMIEICAVDVFQSTKSMMICLVHVQIHVEQI